MNNDEIKNLKEIELEKVSGGTMGQASSEMIKQGIIQGFSRRFNVPVDKINERTTLEELGADSLDVVDVVSEVEERLGIKIMFHSPIETVGTVVNQALGIDQ